MSITIRFPQRAYVYGQPCVFIVVDNTKIKASWDVNKGHSKQFLCITTVTEIIISNTIEENTFYYKIRRYCCWCRFFYHWCRPRPSCWYYETVVNFKIYQGAISAVNPYNNVIVIKTHKHWQQAYLQIKCHQSSERVLRQLLWRRSKCRGRPINFLEKHYESPPAWTEWRC